jgi:D-lactate dehydrogenase
MKVAVFSTKAYDRKFLDLENSHSQANHELVYFESRLEPKTTLQRISHQSGTVPHG